MKRLIFLCLALASPALAAAAVPSPATSTVPCLVVCPLGDISFDVVVRDAASVPVPNSFVQVFLCQGPPVPPIPFCTEPPPCMVSGFTNAAGQVSFSMQAGGVMPGPYVNVYADGIFLASRSIASPDQNADLVVNASDVALGTAAVGTASVTMDLDCDGGLVDADDVGVINAHLGHNCGPTSVAPRSWGRVKILYR